MLSSSTFFSPTDSLLATLYDGVTSPNGFQAFIETAVETYNLAAMTLIVQHRQTQEIKGLWLYGIAPEWVERYAIHYANEDMLARHVMAAPMARFYASNLDVAQPELVKQSAFYREWVSPQGFDCGAAAVIAREGVWFTQTFMLRAADQPPYTREELSGFDMLVPHLQRALRIRESYAGLQASQDVLAGGLNLLAMPTFLVDEHGRVAHMNMQAEKLLHSCATLRLEDRHLLTDNSEASRRLQVEISSAIQASRGEVVPLNEVVLVPRRSHLPLMLTVAPMPTGTAERAQTHGAALIFAFDPAAAPSLTAERLRKMFGFTKAEAALAISLCSGETLEEIAHARSVAPSTVKTHLKRIFAKTGAKRQAEVVSLLLASPAYLLAEAMHPGI